MPLGLGTALWGVVLPKETTNLITNPSFEFGTIGWGTLQAGTIGTTSNFQQFGAWSGSIAPTSNGTTGAISPTFTATNTVAYTFSAYVRGANGIPYKLGVGDSNGVNLVGSTNFTGGGTWQLVVGSWTEAAGATRRLVLQKNSSADTSAFYIDGVQIESGSLTTYIDGDQPGGTWLGAQHNSQSYRSGQYRGGGSVVALADLGLQVNDMLGAGVLPIEVSTQSYAVIDGAEFQRQRGAQRKFTLTGKPVNGTSTADFHVVRRTLYDAFKPDLVAPQQPVRFVYVGGQGTQQIDGYYDSGLELGNMDGPMAENLGVSFISADPYWYAPTQQGTTLAPRVSLGSTNFMAKRSPLGAWGTLGAAGVTIGYSFGGDFYIRSMMFNPSGTMFFGGLFGTVAGTLSPHLGQYYPTTNTFGTFIGGTLAHGAAEVYDFAINPAGTVFLAGQWGTLAGTQTMHVGMWTGAFGTLVGGTIARSSGALAASVQSLVYSPRGSLILGGNFGTTGGTKQINIGFWNGNYGSFGGNIGLETEGVSALAWGLDNQTLYIEGNFSSAGGTRGTSTGFFKNGAFGTMGDAVSNGGAGIVYTNVVAPNGVLYEGGQFDTLQGGSANNVGQWNGIQQRALGSGVQVGAAQSALVRCSAVDPLTGNILFGGSITQAGGISVGAGYAIWNGASWVLPDIGRSNSPGTVFAMTYGLDNTLYIAGDFSGTAYAASTGTIVNFGRSVAYPTARIRNTSASGTARIYQLANTTTGQYIWFNLTLLPQEQATLTLTPGNRSFTSSFAGNIFGAILPGSNLATFNLETGPNIVSFFTDTDTVDAAFYWTPRGWSADSGTVY